MIGINKESMVLHTMKLNKQPYNQDTWLCANSQERCKLQCVNYWKRKVPDFNPLHLKNYLCIWF